MVSRLAAALRVYRSEGGATLARKTASYAYTTLTKAVANTYHRYRGRRSFTVNDITATFDTNHANVLGQTRGGLDRETAALSTFLDHLRPDDVVWDVGAHVGLYTVFAAAALNPDHGQVVAFEPYPPNAEQLRRNAALNPAPVYIYQLALSDDDGKTAFRHPDADTVGAGLPAITATGDGATRVDTARGDSLVAEGRASKPTVVKIDVEGAEPLVVDGLRETLAGDACRVVLCEVHLPTDAVDRDSLHDYGSTQSDFETTLEDLGFTITARHPRQRYDDLHLVATKGGD